MRSFVARVRERLDVSLWVVPSLCLAASAGLSVAAEAIDRRLSAHDQAWYLFQGGPEGARALLSAVGSSMMTFTGVVFSVTILVLQLASNPFSPRVMRSFLRDRGTQMVLGIFVGTFLYSLLGLRSVRAPFAGAKAYVPALTVSVALVLAVGCIASFVHILHHEVGTKGQLGPFSQAFSHLALVNTALNLTHQSKGPQHTGPRRASAPWKAKLNRK